MFESISPILISLVVIAFVLYRQLRPRKLSRGSLIIIPLIILFFIIKSFPTFHPSQKEIFDMVIMSIVSIVLGLLATRELHVYKGPTDKAMSKGNWTYCLWWIAAFVIKGILSVLFGETSPNSINEIEILIPVFLLITTRSAYIYWKVQKLGLTLH